MKKIAILSTILLLCSPILSIAQTGYKTLVHSFGLELSQSVSLLGNMSSAEVLYEAYSPGFGASIVVPYQYAPESSFLGFQSGLGFFMWGTRYSHGMPGGTPGSPGTSVSTENQSLYFIGVPLVAQLKVSRNFWVELGAQGNVPMHHSGRYAEAEHSGNGHPIFPIGIMSGFEAQGLFGFRYHMYRSLSVKFRTHLGFTSAYRIEYTEMITGNERTDRYRQVGFEVGLSYLFPLKR